MKKISFISLLILLFIACEKDADIDIQEMEPVPVIEGKFSNFAPDSFFKITMSKGFERTGYEYEPVTDAQLSVTDSHGNVINFFPDNEGVYRTTSAGIPGETYTLNLTKGTHHLTARSTMPEQISLTGFEFRLITQSNNNFEGKLKLYFDDPENQVDYYMARIFYSDLVTHDYQYQYDVYFDDSNYNKSKHSLILHIPYYNGTRTSKIKLFHLNKSYVDYLNTLKQLGEMGYGESPFQTAVPGNPETNVKGGIGYFATIASDSLGGHFN